MEDDQHLPNQQDNIQVNKHEGNAPMLPNEDEMPPKRSLCRFYVRGLCMLPKETCRFAHGIDDLDYQPWVQGEAVEQDYLKDTVFCQKKAVKGPRIYINLYEFQSPKKYTLEQLNSERPLRQQVRTVMHKQLFHDFIELLQKRHPGINMTEAFLMREYTRAGFNKLMTRIKFSHLTSFLCDAEGSKYFRKSLIMPPSLKNQTTYIFRRASEEEAVAVYRQGYQQIIKEAEGPLEEAVIKKKLFQMPIPHVGIPPLTLLLKERRLSFADFLEVLNGSSIDTMMEKVKLEAKPEEMVEWACGWLQRQGKARLVGWGELYQQLSKQFKINNGNVINQVKPLLVLQGYCFLYFPTVQFIHHPQLNFDFSSEALSNCPCEFRNPFPISDFQALLESGQTLEEGESVDINNLESLLRWGGVVLRSKVVGVDLQGNLRRGGWVQMVQINNQTNTFLFDIFAMHQNGDHQAIALTKKLLRNVMVDPAILKIFHDCRHDSLALHLFLNTCIVNVFDTSAAETALMQLQAYRDLALAQDKQSKAKNVLAQSINIKTLGLNEILKRYEASHGINRHKQRFHRMWAQGEVALFEQRPLDPDYREYCIKDVLDLPEVYHKIEKQKSIQEIHLCQWVSSTYVRQGYDYGKEEQ